MAGSGWNPSHGEGQPSASRSEGEDGQPKRYILIVEDNASDVFLIRTAIRNANIDANLQVVRDGEQAVLFFERADSDETIPCPALVILDINLPRRQGSEVLEQIRKSRRCRCAPVMVVSTSNSPQDRENMTRLGANGYFHKPSAYADFLRLGELIREMLKQKT